MPMYCSNIKEMHGSKTGNNNSGKKKSENEDDLESVASVNSG